MPLRITLRPYMDDEHLQVHFDVLLTRRPSTFTVYVGKGYTPDSLDTLLLQEIMLSLLSDGSGARQIEVSGGYVMTIKRSMAVPLQDIFDRIMAAARRVGTTPVLV